MLKIYIGITVYLSILLFRHLHLGDCMSAHRICLPSYLSVYIYTIIMFSTFLLFFPQTDVTGCYRQGSSSSRPWQPPMGTAGSPAAPPTASSPPPAPPTPPGSSSQVGRQPWAFIQVLRTHAGGGVSPIFRKVVVVMSLYSLNFFLFWVGELGRSVSGREVGCSEWGNIRPRMVKIW